MSPRAAAGAQRFYSHGVARGDFDADGVPDLLITGYGGLQLLHNLGDGTFEDVTAGAGLDDRAWSSSAGWGDVNGDGWLDLYVAHYVDWSFENHPHCPGLSPGSRDVCSPREFRALRDTLFLSSGNGTFADASDAAALRSDGKGLGVLLADLDRDGDLEIYVANDTVNNHLYGNDGGGRFSDRTLTSGTGVSEGGFPDGSMGVGLLDFDRDGRLDLWVVNYERESNALYRNQGDLLFQHISTSTGVAAVGGMFVGWGTSAFDLELDGDEDLFVSNGHVVHFPPTAPVLQTPVLLQNDAGRRVRNMAPEAGGYFAEAHHGRGAACGDLNGDGRIDLVISRDNQSVALLLQQRETQSHWLSIELIGTASARDPIGATVRVRIGADEQFRQFSGGGSYASTHSRRLHFGLGTAGRIDELEVQWPSGVRQTLRDVPVDRTLLVTELPGSDGSAWVGTIAP